MGNGWDSPEDFARLVRGWISNAHKDSALAAIRFPDPHGAFPQDILLRPPPVVVDANVFRNDILRACRTGQRTVLVTAANAGLLRLFCAEHVYHEVSGHSGDWTRSGPVRREQFLRRWLLEYLPLLRVVRIDEAQLAWLDPAERARICHLARPDQDPDDVPSATLALLLEAFFLSGDRRPLRAVYGDAGLAGHEEWVSILKAGGDAGELGRSFTLAVNVASLAGQGVAGGVRRVAGAASPWVLLLAGLSLAGWYFKASSETKQRLGSAAGSVLTRVLGAAIAYEEVHRRFASAAPITPGWESMAASIPPGAVLGRACLHTLARSTGNDRSAAELAKELPFLGVAQGDAKVRQILRGGGPFAEVWRGRWQAGQPGPALLRYLQTPRAQASAA